VEMTRTSQSRVHVPQLGPPAASIRLLASTLRAWLGSRSPSQAAPPLDMGATPIYD
jgi:hypothetical protein